MQIQVVPKWNAPSLQGKRPDSDKPEFTPGKQPADQFSFHRSSKLDLNYGGIIGGSLGGAVGGLAGGVLGFGNTLPMAGAYAAAAALAGVIGGGMAGGISATLNPWDHNDWKGYHGARHGAVSGALGAVMGGLFGGMIQSPGFGLAAGLVFGFLAATGGAYVGAALD